ncbi:MAG: 2-keto-4-pentenoate hydratase [Gammaproteobacteria bacterium MedPE]|nr:MAG: 2-keto-4-pentenoate hydratase [Gammaproteobacteria bacterium MedPE]
MNSVNLDDKPITPSKVICIGRNYVDHIQELGNEMPDEMVVFLKPNSAISNELISFHQEPLHYEGEICLMVIGGEFRAVGFGLDLTKRQLQSKLKAKGLPWERAKAFDGSAVMGDFVSIENIDDSLSLKLAIDGEAIQQGGVELMMYKPQQILESLKEHFTLEDGDIVMTGTPKGVGKINAGGVFHGQINQANKTLISSEWQAN